MTHTKLLCAPRIHARSIVSALTLLASLGAAPCALAAQPPAQNGAPAPGDASVSAPDPVDTAAPTAPTALGSEPPSSEAATPPAPYGNAAPATPPASPPGDQGAAEATPAEPRHGLVPLLRVGYMVGGSGDLEEEGSGGKTKLEYDDISSAVLEFDLLGHLSPGLRMGGGLIALPTSSVHLKGGSDYDVGSEGALVFIVEGVFDLSPKVALTLRGYAGFDVLNIGGDLKDARESICEDQDCSWDDQYTGATAGLGLGLLIPLKSVNLRADFMTQAYSVSGTFASVGSAKADHTLSGSRSFLMAGLEL
ncbi:MAG: hypothetical protein H6718_03740 [Polyangiaceae bacterium]|nr:hypothetical protein [Polyangiaceae bacterium]MCB9609322.1 hypothetical protein [Polyangiaceae bacterium]